MFFLLINPSKELYNMTNQKQIMKVVSSIKCYSIFYINQINILVSKSGKQNVRLLFFKYDHPVLLRTATKFS